MSTYLTSARFVIAVTIAALFSLTPVVQASENSANSICVCGGFIENSDVDQEGFPLTVGDLVFLIRALIGDTVLSDSATPELDNYANSFFPCKPTIGDVIAFLRVVINSGVLPINPDIDCSNLITPGASDIVMVMSPPITISGIGSTRILAKLRNTGSDTTYIWGISAPLKFVGTQDSADILTAGIVSLPSHGVWNTFSRGGSSESTFVFVFPETSIQNNAITLAPGEEIDFFEVELDWQLQDTVFLSADLYASAPYDAPYIVTTLDPPSSKPLPRTEILNLITEDCSGVFADADTSGSFDVSDVIFLVKYIFQNGRGPVCFAQGDNNGSHSIDISDVVTGLKFIFDSSDVLPTCANCPCLILLANINELDDVGDINLNGLGYEIADYVVLTNYLINGPSAFHINSRIQLGACDIDGDCVPATLADLFYLTNIITGNLLSGKQILHSHYTKTATITVQNGVISSDMDLGVALFKFAGEATVTEISSNAVISILPQGGYSIALINRQLYSPPENFPAGDILSSTKPPIFVAATDTLGNILTIRLVYIP
ncbi:MAG: hypothetical protein IIB00_03340 [candidate division Zixibacteria bacterium]|nr:hypothetical protein [candidate division Zixibacteria bacterium]